MCCCGQQIVRRRRIAQYELVGDQVGTRLAMGPEGGYLVFQDTARLEKLYKAWGFNTLLIDLREARQGVLFE